MKTMTMSIDLESRAVVTSRQWVHGESKKINREEERKEKNEKRRSARAGSKGILGPRRKKEGRGVSEVKRQGQMGKTTR